MDKLHNKCLEFFKNDDINKMFIKPTFTMLYNELYLYILLICIYHIIFISIIIIILCILINIYNNVNVIKFQIHNISA